jgi:alpha-L-rhamnosidase
MREYKNPDAYRARFDSDNAREKVIFEAARETFAQNAVDTYTDCPGRERAGWLCDSFFTARAAQLFTGSTGSERTFLENYLLAEDFAPLPRGMVPMCYPADHPKREFIPNWSMWLILELEEYLARSGDRALVDAFRPRVQGLLDFYAKYLNSDGLLEKLPSWVLSNGARPIIWCRTSIILPT